MSWVRLDDQFSHHPKLTACGPSAGLLFVASLCFSNRFLTDGFIPSKDLAGLCPAVRYPRKCATKLLKVGFWHKVDGGYRIHDYQQFQASAAVVQERREKRSVAGRKGAAARWANGNSHSKSHDTADPEKTGSGPGDDGEKTPKRPGDDRENAADRVNGSETAAIEDGKSDDQKNAPIPSHPKDLDLKNDLSTSGVLPPPPIARAQSRAAAADARSGRVIYRGQRLKVHDFTLDDLELMLGPHTAAFELDVWFDRLDHELQRTGEILPARDGGAWVLRRTVEEARCRGLPVAVGDLTAVIGKPTSRLLHAIANIKTEP